MPYEVRDSRRLTGPSLWLDAPGAVLDVAVPAEEAGRAAVSWERHLRALLDELGLETTQIGARHYAGGLLLAFAAPVDVLYAATEVNEAAWAAVAAERAGNTAPDRQEDVERLCRVLEEERDPAFAALYAAASERGLSCLWDGEAVSVGTGAGSCVWPKDALPSPAEVDWGELHDIPLALVTGTNGKSTTVRLLAAILRAAGRVAGMTTTDHVAIGDEVLDEGDYSGPSGARLALRDPRVDAAVLEIARGGLLRRGLSVPHATVAAVTNVATDHLGEYGVETVEDLAEAKFTVSKALGPGGTLVAAADDPASRVEALRRAPALAPRGVRLAWTALEPEVARSHVERTSGQAWAVVDGALTLWEEGRWVPVVPVADVPSTFGGAARHNVRNALTAAASAYALGVSHEAIADGLRRFRSDVADNPGRGNLLTYRGARLLIDYAHNAAGLAALLDTLEALPAERRLVLLGHAGDRSDEQIGELARVAATLRADRYLAVDLPDYLRGRAPGEVPALLRRVLIDEGIREDAVDMFSGPPEAVRAALDWAQPGDLLLLLVLTQRAEVMDVLREAAVI